MYSYADIHITVFTLVGTCSTIIFPECLVPLDMVRTGLPETFIVPNIPRALDA